MEEVRRRVIALRVASPLTRNARRNSPEPERAGDSADRRRPAVDLLDVVDVYVPPVAGDLSVILDLAARLRVERRFAQQDRHATVGEMLDRRHLCLDLDRIVADERRMNAGRRRTFRRLPLLEIAERIG